MVISATLKSVASTIVLIAFPASVLQAAEMIDYERDVRPVLEEHCFKCHGPDKQKSDLRLDTLSTDLLKDRPAAETWHDVLDNLNLGEMPPDDEPELSSEKRQVVTGWIREEIKTARASQKSAGGEIVLRRLNRVEYRNTMSDLLGIRAEYDANLPPDTPSEEGFKNNGAVLSMSPLQLEYYLDAARKGLARAIVTGPVPEKISATITKTSQGKGRENFTDRLGIGGSFLAKLEKFPDEGEFVVRIKARAELVDGAAFPQMKAVFGYRADTQFPSKDLGLVDVTSEESKVYEFRGRMEQFPVQTRTQSKYPGQLISLTNEFTDGKKRKDRRQIEVEQVTKNKKGVEKIKTVKKTEWIDHPDVPKIVIESVEFIGPVFDAWPPEPHRRILISPENREKGELVYAEEVVANFMRRAYRRPVEGAEVKSMLRLFSKIRPNVDTFEEALRETLALVLVSPDFLYLIEPEEGNGEEGIPLTDFELASRLSYFLWSTMPDNRLLDLASSGELRNPETMSAEIDRMLSDEKSWQFVEQFTNQWLDLASVDRVAVNPEYYDDWDTSIEPWMQKETQHFFAEVLQKDLSTLQLIDSDFVMVNARMAQHYGIEDGPRGTGFERVALPADSKRGGLLTHASILLGNSTGEDSHPILRAVWLRERLLDDPPLPPPPNVPALDSENPDFEKLPIRRQLEIHREDPACDDCHRGIDPWGIALEAFDAVGNWRDEIRRKSGRNKFTTHPVDSGATLPDGKEVDGVEGLKKYLIEHRKEQFSRAVVSRLSSYALGRSLEFEDEEAIDTLMKEYIASEYRLRPLIKAITASELFQTK